MVEPMAVDEEGLRVDDLPQDCRLVFVTPSHQYPLGVTMTLRRRLDLLSCAAQNESYVLEDDYDSDFRYTPKAIPALKALDRADRVIYIGSFSKVLVPSIRLGFLIVPDSLVEAVLRARSLLDRGSPSLEQATLSAFLSEGHFDSHLRRMRRLYSDRQRLLLEAVEEHCGSDVRISPSPIGMHLVAHLPETIPAERLAAIGEAHGLDLTPLSRFAVRERTPNGVMLGYTVLNERTIREGVVRLSRCLREVSGR